MAKYEIQGWDVWSQKWKRNIPEAPKITKASYNSYSDAKSALNNFVKKSKKANAKAESNLRPNSYGSVQIPNLRIKKR